MKILVVYDTAYGNTETVAQHIASVLGPEARLARIDSLDPASLPAVDLVIAGSPTQGGQATAAMRRWLAALPRDTLGHVNVAAFDTRLPFAGRGFALSALMSIVGYAAPRMLRLLVGNGGTAVAEPAGFLVEGREGPLAAGQLDAAARWAHSLIENVNAKRDAA